MNISSENILKIIYKSILNNSIPLIRKEMKESRILIITAHRIVSAEQLILQCMHFWIYIVHVQGVTQKYFGHGVYAIFTDSIFT